MAHSFRGLVHYLNGRKHCDPQADMMLEKKPSVLHLNLQTSVRERITEPSIDT